MELEWRFLASLVDELEGEREIFNLSFPFVSDVELDRVRERGSFDDISSANRRVFFDGFGG